MPYGTFSYHENEHNWSETSDLPLQQANTARPDTTVVTDRRLV
uniref:Uncharacterized protein n=1 Tax=Arundo donax TaxID=35708 RepID=A0A0A9HAP2_ARUDO